MKNILAENMLRFRSKNIAAQEAAAIRKLIEQMEKIVNVDLIDTLKGKKLTIVSSPNNDLIAFPRSGMPKVGDPAILHMEGAVYQSGTGSTASSYILLGNIGKLTGGEGNWGIKDNSSLKVFTYQKPAAAPTNRAGRPIVPEKPYGTPTTVTDAASIISTLTKHEYGNQSLLNRYPQEYITDLIKLFQTMNQLRDVPTDTNGVMAWTRENLS